MNKNKSKKYFLIQTLRQIGQTLFFLLFLYLFLKTQFPNGDYIGPVEIIFHFDPLLAITTFLSSHKFFLPFLFSLITIGVTLFLGRVFCGWICPLGTINHFFSFLFIKSKLSTPAQNSPKRLAWKYYLLIFILISSVFSLDLAGVFDPLSLTFRSFTISVFPASNYLLSKLLDIFYNLNLISVGDFFSQIHQYILINSNFKQGFFIGLIFIIIILLNLSRNRFWCKYLCPLGALFGLISKWNILKLNINRDDCIECDLCNQYCSGEANPFPEDRWNPSECIYCFKCGAICPTRAVDFNSKLRPEKRGQIDLERRKWIFTAILGVIAVPFFRISPSQNRSSPKLIRPPGALPEEEFLKKCVRCGECMKVCPTNGLQPCIGEGGVEGFWTPVLVPTIGYCEYNCTLCGQVCPSGAIKELPLEEKKKIKIGLAFIDKNRCLPYFGGISCIVCEEHCPTSPKAIKFVQIEVTKPNGNLKKVLAPVVDTELCVGCGICETKCPVVDQPAIYITSIGETRSEKNRLILELQEPTSILKNNNQI
ncbi:MAG: 4Fe-4S binding protein [Candidatus Aminicenantia bacterium]